MHKLTTAIILVICFFGLDLNIVFAAEGGGRPISLGGAFVAIADDVHAVSWNPAGMAWQENSECTYAAILNNRDKYVTADLISDDYFSFVQPLKSGYERNFANFGGMGFFVHNSGYDRNGVETDLYHYGLAYGRKISSEEMAIGVSLTQYSFSAETNLLDAEDSAISINLGWLWYYSNSISFGCLCENVFEPGYSLFGVKSRLFRVFRPAIAYYPNDRTTISFDIYDLTGNTKNTGCDLSQDIRVGIEHYLSDSVSIRVGAHHPNSKEDTVKFYSFGMGLQRADFLGLKPINYYLDYSFIYWQKSLSGMDKYTHQLGITIGF
ncbi:MAG: hypothetical protein DRP78_05300 [Candidatus Omnitrophota bacterium]|nr:MAG: hypothetical protein DRP78_05300 [Candidatus Omnitrophota bacterium]